MIELAELFDLLFLSLPSRWPDIAVRRPTAMNTYELLTLGSVVVVVVVFYLARVPEARRPHLPKNWLAIGL